MINQYITEIKQLLEIVENEEMDVLKEAAQRIAETIQADGIIHLFGCGHSHMLGEEVYYRAGGLVPVHPILHEPLMLHEGTVKSSELERKTGYAQTFLEDEDIRTGDIMVVISTSGRNPVPVDAAKIAKEKGAYVIGITSEEYSKSQHSRHPSGEHLADAVDLVINNYAPAGDALLAHNRVKVRFSPSSTVIGATILNAVFAEAITIMAENDFDPPVFLSGNIDGADEHNQRLMEKYRERIKF